MGIPTHLVPVDGNANDGGFVTDCLLSTSCPAVSDEQLHLEHKIYSPGNNIYLEIYTPGKMLLNVFQPLGAPASLAGEAKKIQTHWKVHLAYQPPTKKIKSKYLFK